MITQDTFTPKPVHYRYLRAVVDVIEKGGQLTQVALARELGVGRIAIWKLHRKYPGLAAWVSEQLGAVARHHNGPVMYRVALSALRGSEPHARLYFAVTGQLGPTGGEPAPAGGMTFRGPTIVNLAVPRPGDPPVHADEKRVGSGTT